MYTMAEKIKVDKQTLAEKMIIYEGKPLDFEEYFFWPALWSFEKNLSNLQIDRYVLAGRQVGKSSFLSTDICVESLPNNVRSLYVGPQEAQTKMFSNTRLSKMLMSPKVAHMLYSAKSPLIAKDMRDIKQMVKNDVFTKMFVNGSYINMSYAQDDPDRVRGFSADNLNIDEGSLMDLNEILNVVSYVIRSSKKPRILVMGTPLYMDSLTARYDQSMQITIQIRCGCGNWQGMDSLEIIDYKNRQILCSKCGKALDNRGGKFIVKNPTSDTLGMHVNMLMLPSLMDPESATGNNTWSIIKRTLTDPFATEDKVKQELLGVPAGEGARLITDKDLDALPRIMDCTGDNFDYIKQYSLSNGFPLSIGIDWGGGILSEEESSKIYTNSHTAITIAAVKPNSDGMRLEQKILYNKMYPLENPADSLKDIMRIINFFKDQTRIVTADAGGGNFSNPILNEHLQNFGYQHIGFFPVQMVPRSEIPLKREYNKLFVVKRQLITEYYRKIKMKEISVYNGDLKLWYASLLAQIEVINNFGERFWKRNGTTPDDLLFSSLFSYLGGLALFGLLGEFSKPM